MLAWRAWLAGAGCISHLRLRLSACASHPITSRHLPPSDCSTPQETHSLQTKQRQLQAALAEAQKEARAAVGQSDRLATLQVRLGFVGLSCHVGCGSFLPCVSRALSSCSICWPWRGAAGHPAGGIHIITVGIQAALRLAACICCSTCCHRTAILSLLLSTPPKLCVATPAGGAAAGAGGSPSDT